jgi:hypothetical protein
LELQAEWAVVWVGILCGEGFLSRNCGQVSRDGYSPLQESGVLAPRVHAEA